MGLYSLFGDLPVTIERLELRELSSAVPGGWTRLTTLVVLHGAGETGIGEDVTWQDEDQLHFRAHGTSLDLIAQTTLDGASRRLDELDLMCGREPADAGSRDFRQWAFESALADLALRQSGRSLSEVLGRTLRPLTFVTSLGLGSPPSVARLRELRAAAPTVGYKVDYSEDWTVETVEVLSGIDGVATIDLKGRYRGAFQGPAADAEMYRRVADGLPQAYIEDPEWNEETAEALGHVAERVVWDAPLHSLADVLDSPTPVRAVSIKPSRFGTWRELLSVYEHCEAEGIAMYSGGQFELGIGRDQVQYLAAMFHSDAPNDCAPRAFNASPRPAHLPTSPLQLAPAPTGFALA